MSTLYSSLPGTANFVLPWVITNSHGSTRQCYWQFNYLVDGDFASLYTSADFQADTGSWVLSLLDGVWRGQQSPIYGQWWINVPSHHRQVNYGYSPSGFTPQPAFASSLNIPIYLQSDTLNKRGQGRVAFPWPVPADLDGSRVAPAFATRIASLISFYMTPVTFGGATFRSAVWSRADNVMRPVRRIRLGTQASWLQKRTPKYHKRYNQNFPPDIW